MIKKHPTTKQFETGADFGSRTLYSTRKIKEQNVPVVMETKESEVLCV